MRSFFCSFQPSQRNRGSKSSCFFRAGRFTIPARMDLNRKFCSIERRTALLKDWWYFDSPHCTRENRVISACNNNKCSRGSTALRRSILLSTTHKVSSAAIAYSAIFLPANTPSTHPLGLATVSCCSPAAAVACKTKTNKQTEQSSYIAMTPINKLLSNWL